MARTGYGVTTHSVTATGSNDGSKQVSLDAWNANHVKSEAGMLGFTAETIASASSITPSSTTIILSGSTSIDTIAVANTNDKDVLYVFTSGTVTLNNTSSPSSSGDIRLLADDPKDLSATVPTMLMRVGTYWYEFGGTVTSSVSANDLTGTTLASGVVTSSLTQVGTIATGTWQGTAVADSYVASAATWNAKQSALTFGIADGNAVDIDGSGTATGEYAKFTANGIIGEEVADVKTDLSLNNVENTAISTWAGTTNVTTLGTIGTGTWAATDVAVAHGGTGSSTASAARTALGVAIGSDVQIYNANTALTTNKISDFASSTSAELAGKISDETGSGALVFATSPTLVTPALGTPASGTLTNCTFPTLNQSTTGSSASCTGNSATATALATGRTIGITGDIVWTSPSFDGSDNVTAASTIQAGAVELSMIANAAKTQALIIAASDETTALTTGTAKATFRMPYAFTLTGIRASVTTAPTGSVLTVDVNEGGSTILSTKITIDASEKTSTTAATAPVLSDTALADDAEMTIDIDGVGSTVAGAGLKVALIGYKT